MSQSPSVLNAPARLLFPVMATLVALLASGGCTRVHETYPQRSAAEVWIAMRAVAEEPRYPDWVVVENGVHADESTQRIEIYRELRRDLAMPATRIQRETRTWRFRVELKPTDPPKAVFTSRGWAVPAHASMEAEAYFAEVAALLSGIEPAPSAPPAPRPASATEPTTPPPTAPRAPEPPERPAAPARPTAPPVDIDSD